MTEFAALPRVMLAPNGARRGRCDHPALPVTIAQIVETARAAYSAGAEGLHAHVRDDKGAHVLDAGLYRELIAELSLAVPGMLVQITTEAIGRYSPAQQRALVREVRPRAVSIALREMCPMPEVDSESAAFYDWANDTGIAVQHILYDPGDVSRLATLVENRSLRAPAQVLFVLGRYQPPAEGDPNALEQFLAAARALPSMPDWAVCAFGRTEQACLLHAARLGGKLRIGFENNLQRPNGTPAKDNAEQVQHLMRALAAQEAASA